MRNKIRPQSQEQGLGLISTSTASIQLGMRDANPERLCDCVSSRRVNGLAATTRHGMPKNGINAINAIAVLD